jgi:hypothetical protein
MANERQHREHRLDEHTVLPLTALTQFQVGRVAFHGMKAGVAQDSHAPVDLANQPLKHVRVAIGRAPQPFPRSKRSRHVSAHSAFQLGLSTLEGRIRLERWRGAPASEGHHLPSSLHPLTSLLTGLP